MISIPDDSLAAVHSVLTLPITDAAEPLEAYPSPFIRSI